MSERSNPRPHAALLLMGAALIGGGPALASSDSPPPEHIQITATRIPEDAGAIPGSVTILSGEDLRLRGARDLRGALALAAGLDIAPGGDGGPAGSVPELWGLKEFDAFLLVVDGVPWGGAFVPALATLDLADVERIEVVRGPAPVMYGATSFVGVIQVIHRAPGTASASAGAALGSYGSGTLEGVAPLPAWGRLKSTVSGSVERVGYDEDRTQIDAGRFAWRGSAAAGGGNLHLTFTGTWLEQEPGSPHPRVGVSLTPAVPYGANHNPDGASLDETRLQVAGGFDREAGPVLWSSSASVMQSNGDRLRGFLTDVAAPAPNARGFRQQLDVTEIYLDSHISSTSLKPWRLIGGIDHLQGRGSSDGDDFDYFIGLRGDDPPGSSGLSPVSDVRLRDTRAFSGLYGQAEWTPGWRWRLQAGARLNRTTEEMTARRVDATTLALSSDRDSRAVLRGSGSAGLTFTAWQKEADALRGYLSYSSTYKPAVAEFGFDGDAELLEPETGKSFEAGVKSRLAQGRLEIELSGFQMDLRNLVVTQSAGGLPGLANAGRERLRGLELESDWWIRPDLRWRAAYALHDARFRDYLTEFGGVPTQLDGNRIEMSARNLASMGLLYAPGNGFVASAQANYVGSRFLNKRNTALAPAYTTWSAGLGFRTHGCDLRLDAANVNDQHPAVAESELGDAQYYRLPSRRIVLSATWKL